MPVIQDGQVMAWDAVTEQFIPQFVGDLPPGGGGSGFLVASNNLSDLTDVPAARSALGLGSAALQPSSAFVSATSTQNANRVLAGPVSGSAAAPSFRALVAADLPSHAHAAGDITSGQLALARGGTAADLSGRGARTQVLMQTSAGATVTVAQLSASNLSNGVSGSGAVVLASSPTLVTPALGAATATSINKVAITAPATAATLTIADGKTATHNATTTFAGVDGKTLTINNTLTLAGTDSKALTLTGSLTIGADASITGGGTLALAGFTITAPATGTLVITARALTAGAGLTGGGDLSADRTFSLGTPSTLTVSSANSASGTTHTHALDVTTAGAASKLVATDASGQTALASLLASGATFNLANATATTINFGGAATSINVGAAGGTATFASALLNPLSPYTTDLGQLTRKFRVLHAAELVVQTLVSQETITTIGGRAVIPGGARIT